MEVTNETQESSPRITRPFLDTLPRELRLIIYRYVFMGSAVGLSFNDHERIAIRDLTETSTLFNVCRTFQEEAISIFGSQSTVLVSHNADWSLGGLRQMLSENPRVHPNHVQRLDHKIVLKQLGFGELMARPDAPYCPAAGEMDIHEEARTAKSVFPALETYILTPAILVMFPGLEIFKYTGEDGRRIEANSRTSVSLAVSQAIQQPSQHGILGFLNSQFVQSQLLDRAQPINRWLYAVAGARRRHADWSGLPDVLMDTSLCIYGEAWKSWPGLEAFDWALDEDAILRCPTRFADRVPPLIPPKTNISRADYVQAVRVPPKGVVWLLS